jgi:hypothetical protein
MQDGNVSHTTVTEDIKHQTYNKELPLAIARMRMQMSNKRNVVLYLDKDLVEKSRAPSCKHLSYIYYMVAVAHHLRKSSFL